MSKTLFTVLCLFAISFSAEKMTHKQLQIAKRDNDRFYVWVYFADKGSVSQGIKKNIQVHSRAEKRRLIRGTIKDPRWHDTKPLSDYVKAVEAVGAKLRKQSRWLNAISIEISEDQLGKILKLPFVTHVEPVHRFIKKPLSPEQVNSRNSVMKSFHDSQNQSTKIDYGFAAEQIIQIHVNEAHDAGYYGEGITILMLDSGFNLVHESFDSLNITATYDFIQDDSIVVNQIDKGDSTAQHNHGTYTFSILGGYMPGYLVGPAFRANFLLAKTEIVEQEIELEEDNYVAGLEWGESMGADIASSSLGFSDWYSYEDMDGNTAVTTRAVNIAAGLGVLVVTAAGNEGDDDWYYIHAPADADSVISVGAVNGNGKLTDFSSRGPTFDRRIKPEVVARGRFTAAASPRFEDGYVSESGTSMSTPLVAGAAALVLQAHPDWDPMMIREALMKTADRANSPDNEYGYGIINTWKAIKYTSGSPGDPPSIPKYFELYPAFPNPFNATTTIQYDLEADGFISLTIIDILGRKVRALVNSFQPAGTYWINWNGSNNQDQTVGTGIYFIHLEKDNHSDTKKVVLLR
jgi:subtilisin family serine protease